MVFELSDALFDEIMNALENQEKNFLVDAQNGVLICDESKEADEENYYSLPGWNSADGFSLMEDFVNGLHSPLAHNELSAVLHSGKGVFRGFKDVLKSYPEIQRKWHFFKTRQLENYVKGWYSDLRETWGLERLDCETEDIEDLVHDDFIFEEYDPAENRGEVLGFLDSVEYDLGEGFSEEVEAAIKCVARQQFECNHNSGEAGFVCRSAAGDFAGCVVYSPCPSESKKTILLTVFFVLEKYRGLGIAKELLSMALSSCSNSGYRWVLIADTYVPDAIAGLLARSGFVKTGSGYLVDLSAQFI